MKIRKPFLALLCCLLVMGSVRAQAPKPLQIGEKMPDVTSMKVIRYDKKTFKSSDAQSKLLILDFWATYCPPCIKNFPKADSLQMKFGDKVQIMLVNCQVTEDTETMIQKFYEKRYGKEFKLPTIYDDTVLMALFPHEAIPHYVWINNGVVAAITGSEQVTEENIKKMISGDPVRLPVKTD